MMKRNKEGWDASAILLSFRLIALGLHENMSLPRPTYRTCFLYRVLYLPLMVFVFYAGLTPRPPLQPQRGLVNSAHDFSLG